MKKCDVAMIGLSVMGRSLALNLCDHGYEVAGYNRSRAVTEELLAHTPHERFTPFYDLKELISALSCPRKVLLMVKAGAPVDALMEQLFPLLEAGDLLLDCGNSHFTDTIRRTKTAKEHGIHFFGVGVSGGEEGARFGPAIMPGGDKAVYEQELQTMLEAIAAKAPDGTPCCSYIGPDGAGHYVKMVHNGIEYADMQLIAETYLLLKQAGGFSPEALSDLFSVWNEGELQSYLIDITAQILREPDDLTNGMILDVITDSAGQKGTGRWTSIQALEQGVDVSMISAATGARILSNDLAGRAATAKLLDAPTREKAANAGELAETVRRALYTAKILAYTQGFALLRDASSQFGWSLHLGKIAQVFRAGCIIRAVFLDEISKAFTQQAALTSLAHAPFFLNKIKENQPALRHAAALAVESGVPAPSFLNAVSYLDALRGAPMGANLIQAQRDFFGAHTYSRNDREGIFHHNWGCQNG